MRTSLRLALVGMLFTSALPQVLAQTRIPWLQNLQEAQQIANQERRLLLIHFYSDTCPPCRKLEQVVFPNPEVCRVMSMNYIPVKVNGERDRDTAKQYQVDRWPTDVIADAQGRVVYKTISPQDPTRYAQLLNAVAADFRATMAPVAAAGRDSPLVDPAAGYALAAYNNRPDSRAAPAYPAVDPRTGPENSPAGPGQSYAARDADPYLAQVRTSTDAGLPPSNSAAPMPREQVNPYVGQYAPASAANGPPQEHAYNLRSSWSPPPTEGGATPERPASQAVTMPTNDNTPPRQAWQENRFVSNQSAPEASGASAPPPAAGALADPPQAMDGFCPVTLLEQERWVKGDPRWGAVHRGCVYLFLSQQHQQRFLSDPDRYSPVLSGFDPARYIDRGDLVAGQRAHGMWFRGKTYLFADEQSLDRFSRAPEFYAQRAHEIMMAPGRN
jgi:YHS domain-containing protein/thioredoxin-related protein